MSTVSVKQAGYEAAGKKTLMAHDFTDTKAQT
jgi:hypothetical protein